MKPIICGIDEAGRGCIAGPVVAASIIFFSQKILKGVILKDSKKLSEKQREKNNTAIKFQSAWGIGWVHNTEIDTINIHNATLIAMERSFHSLLENIPYSHFTKRKNTFLPYFKINKSNAVHIDMSLIHAIVDGKFAPTLPISVSTQIKADSIVPEVQAASILAKVSRDSFMKIIDSHLPEYYFNKHKGYPTKLHKQQIKKHGVSYIHRKSFSPIKELI